MELGFEMLFKQFTNIFWMLYETSKHIWNFLTSPLSETIGLEEADILGELANLAPLEFLFGLGITIALIKALVHFFTRFA